MAADTASRTDFGGYIGRNPLARRKPQTAGKHEAAGRMQTLQKIRKQAVTPPRGGVIR